MTDSAANVELRPSDSPFRNALEVFPSGVTIVTAVDGTGHPWGFTASSFCSVSADPPLILVCLAKTAQCSNVFQATELFAVHVIHDQHTRLAQRFATRGADKVQRRGIPPQRPKP